jgi:hypothetical protein
MKTPKQIERLEQFAEFLESDVLEQARRKNKFDMHAWCLMRSPDPRVGWDLDAIIAETKGLPLERNCNTAGCALGWATVRFPRDLRINYVGEVVMTRQRSWDSPETAWRFFGLTDDEIDYLFAPARYKEELCKRHPPAGKDRFGDPNWLDKDGHPVSWSQWITPKMVARRVRGVIAEAKRERERKATA